MSHKTLDQVCHLVRHFGQMASSAHMGRSRHHTSGELTPRDDDDDGGRGGGGRGDGRGGQGGGRGQGGGCSTQSRGM